jgi:hypothetical protein
MCPKIQTSYLLHVARVCWSASIPTGYVYFYVLLREQHKVIKLILSRPIFICSYLMTPLQ